MHYDGVVFERVDWSQRGAYMEKRHGLTPAVANDALGDPDRVVIDPDYNSTSGRSVRIIGFSVMTQEIITVIVLEQDGVEWGVNGWAANEKDRRLYNERGEGGTDGQED
jgi:hypothetical protein